MRLVLLTRGAGWLSLDHWLWQRFGKAFGADGPGTSEAAGAGRESRDGLDRAGAAADRGADRCFTRSVG